jgi:hypothetical protein
MDRKYAAIVTRTTLKIRTSAGSVEFISLTIVKKCRCGGVVARKEKIVLDVSSESMSAKMTKTQMISKRRRNSCRDNLTSRSACAASN